MQPVDMWSLGIILYILLAAEHPFYHRDPRVMFRRVKSGCLDFSARVWTYISEDAKVHAAVENGLKALIYYATLEITE